MKTQTEALKLALETLRMPSNYWNKTQFIKVKEAIAAVEEALAQPEQEPVAWCVYCDGKFNLNIFHVKDVADYEKLRLEEKYPGAKRDVVPLYTTPPQRTWVGLTDEEMKLIDPDGFEDNLPQMIQQALKEKNA